MNQSTFARPAARTVARGLIVATSTLALVAGAGVAGAQVPGGGTGGAVVKTDGTDLVVTVNDKGETPTRVSGAIENVSTASAFRDSFGEDYGVTIADGPMAGLLARAIVVIGADGNVAYTELVPEIAQEPDYDAALAAAK